MSNRAHLGAALCAASLISLATPAFAAGEILLTHAKALAGNVTPGDAPGFPITLSIPGSYQFASVIHPSAGSIGIQVTSQDVTIDLNGFRLHGSGTAFHGITGGVDNVTIRNGTIAGFKFDGIHGTGHYWAVENIRVFENGRYGVRVTGEYPSVRGSTVAENGSNGIVCGARCLVEDSTASGNNGLGISISSGTVLGNVIIGNGGFGIEGTTVTGFGNNTLALNNGGGAEVNPGPIALHPNLCDAACP